jgi:hypothetical protein
MYVQDTEESTPTSQPRPRPWRGAFAALAAVAGVIQAFDLVFDYVRMLLRHL